MKTEEINVSWTHESVEKSFPVVPENIYAVEVIISFIISFQTDIILMNHIYISNNIKWYGS